MIAEIYKYSDIGPRTENQDSIGYLTFDNIIVGCVADGVGGNKNGKFVSNYVVDTFLKEIIHTNINEVGQLIVKINAEILNKQKEFEYSNMASTFTAFIIIDSILYGFHIGDTRMCILRNNGIKQLTKPHTTAYRAYNAKIISLEEYKNLQFKNILENAIGQKTMYFDYFTFSLESNDRIIISSDGFHDVITKQELVELSKKFKSSLYEFNSELSKQIKSKPLTDNNTYLLIEYVETAPN